MRWGLDPSMLCRIHTPPVRSGCVLAGFCARVATPHIETGRWWQRPSMVGVSGSLLVAWRCSGPGGLAGSLVRWLTGVGVVRVVSWLADRMASFCCGATVDARLLSRSSAYYCSTSLVLATTYCCYFRTGHRCCVVARPVDAPASGLWPPMPSSVVVAGCGGVSAFLS